MLRVFGGASFRVPSRTVQHVSINRLSNAVIRAHSIHPLMAPTQQPTSSQLIKRSFQTDALFRPIINKWRTLRVRTRFLIYFGPQVIFFFHQTHSIFLTLAGTIATTILSVLPGMYFRSKKDSATVSFVMGHVQQYRDQIETLSELGRLENIDTTVLSSAKIAHLGPSGSIEKRYGVTYTFLPAGPMHLSYIEALVTSPSPADLSQYMGTNVEPPKLVLRGLVLHVIKGVNHQIHHLLLDETAPHTHLYEEEAGQEARVIRETDVFGKQVKDKQNHTADETDRTQRAPKRGRIIEVDP
ncbi:hypothetical protein PROFUN_01748 [Planoprotostelium fungivorum]|uniref:Transmembrane protein n=1 Tax=Planoprotostelium fungivorum TaxID=1890364 RepID=A0A2P6MWE4_9EUKA|nr:hypothetical protein PROFUN_01748 [Planoprotostelium fungivorum]